MDKIFLPILVHSDLRNKTSDFENLTYHKLAEIIVVLWSKWRKFFFQYWCTRI